MSFARVQTTNREINQLQSNLATALQPVFENPFSNGVFINNQILINGSTRVQHNLGRPIVGWFITNINGAATVYLASSTDQTLTLTSNALVTVNLFVF